jgi:hypothetical protein
MDTILFALLPERIKKSVVWVWKNEGIKFSLDIVCLLFGKLNVFCYFKIEKEAIESRLWQMSYC